MPNHNKFEHHVVPLDCQHSLAENARTSARDEQALERDLPQAGVHGALASANPFGRTVDQLLCRYRANVIPTKAITTQQSNAFAIVQLKNLLGQRPIARLTPQVVTEYFAQRRYKIAARREIEVLSHACTKAVEWGWIERHPFKGQLRLPKKDARSRHIEDWEVIEMMSLKPRHKSGSVRAIQSFIRLMLLTGLRRAQLLRIRTTAIQEHGFDVDVGGGGHRVAFAWTEELRKAVLLAWQSRPADLSDWLFCKADGTAYFNEKTGRADGWDSMWGRFVDRAVRETRIARRFTEHDLRARAVIRTGAVQLRPICPAYLAKAPVAEFTSACAGIPIHQAKRMAQIRLATPFWADRMQIKAYYEKARACTRETGSLHVVDHVVPLHHALVCGLHVPANLRVVSERINAEKHNRFDLSAQEHLCEAVDATTRTDLGHKA